MMLSAINSCSLLMHAGVHFVLKELGIQPHPQGQHHHFANGTLANGTLANGTLLNGTLLNGILGSGTNASLHLASSLNGTTGHGFQTSL